jgi:hypothetical protein
MYFLDTRAEVPTAVFVRFKIREWPKVDDFKNSLSVHLQIATRWKEPRFTLL